MGDDAMKPDPYDNPARNAGVLRNLVHNFHAIHVNAWLETVTFDQVVEAWWAAQGRKAEQAEKQQRKLTTYSTP